jgi:hypothetical protein
MPLIKCHECSSDISDNAISCPSCGTKTKFTLAQEAGKSKRNRLIFLIVGGIIIIISTKVWIDIKKDEEFINSGAARKVQRAIEDINRASRDMCRAQGKEWSYSLNECR